MANLAQQSKSSKPAMLEKSGPAQRKAKLNNDVSQEPQSVKGRDDIFEDGQDGFSSLVNPLNMAALAVASCPDDSSLALSAHPRPSSNWLLDTELAIKLRQRRHR